MKSEVDEFNEFLGASPLRNKFLPIVHHISLLKPEQWKIDEYERDGKTSSVQATISHGTYKGEDDIAVTIHYDTMPNHENEIIYELFWGGENYCLASPTNPPEMQINRVKNMLTMLIKDIGYKDFNCDSKEYRKAQRGEYLLTV